MTPSAKRPPRRLGLRWGHSERQAGSSAAKASDPAGCGQEVATRYGEPGRQGAARLPASATERHCLEVKSRVRRRSDRSSRPRCRARSRRRRASLGTARATRPRTSRCRRPRRPTRRRSRCPRCRPPAPRPLALVVVEQVAQEVGAVGDVDLRRRKIGLLEEISARMPCDEQASVEGDLHQPACARVRGLIAKAGLLVDHRGDQGGIELLVGSLLADDVFVLERKRDLTHRFAERTEPRDESDSAATISATTSTVPRRRAVRARVRRRGMRAAWLLIERILEFGNTRDDGPRKSTQTAPLAA